MSQDRQLAVTVWKDGSFKVWGVADDAYARADPDYAVTLAVPDLVAAIVQNGDGPEVVDVETREQVPARTDGQPGLPPGVVIRLSDGTIHDGKGGSLSPSSKAPPFKGGSRWFYETGDSLPDLDREAPPPPLQAMPVTVLEYVEGEGYRVTIDGRPLGVPLCGASLGVDGINGRAVVTLEIVAAPPSSFRGPAAVTFRDAESGSTIDHEYYETLRAAWEETFGPLDESARRRALDMAALMAASRIPVPQDGPEASS